MSQKIIAKKTSAHRVFLSGFQMGGDKSAIFGLKNGKLLFVALKLIEGGKVMFL